jgi:hypothetical protein
MSYAMRLTEIDEHFCSPSCKRDGPCDLCMAQRRKKREDELRAERKPTLHAKLGDVLRLKVKNQK